MPEGVEREVAGYVELARHFEPEDAPYLQNHRGHLLFVKPEERPFVTANLIRQTTFTAPEAVLRDRIGALREAGYTQFAIQIVPGHETAIEDWARIMRTRGLIHCVVAGKRAASRPLSGQSSPGCRRTLSDDTPGRCAMSTIGKLARRPQGEGVAGYLGFPAPLVEAGRNAGEGRRSPGA